jgi:hypothetical protein
LDERARFFNGRRTSSKLAADTIPQRDGHYRYHADIEGSGAILAAAGKVKGLSWAASVDV